MGFEDVFDLDVSPSMEDLEKLDKAFARAEKRADAIKRKQDKLHGIFRPSGKDRTLPSSQNLAKGGAPINIPELSKNDIRFEKRLDKIQNKIKKDIVKNFGKKEGLLSGVLGDTGFNNIISMGKNPKAFLTGALKAVPFLGGVLAAAEIAQFIVDEIVKIDAFFKRFVDVIDNRTDQLRDKITQAEIGIGKTQLIITTSAGTTNPRDAYNTFEAFNRSRTELEDEFSIRDTSGV